MRSLGKDFRLVYPIPLFMNHDIVEFGLKNLVRHDIRHHGNRSTLFCDDFSQFGVSFPSLAPLGLGALCPRATLSTYHISNPTLQLYLKEGEQTTSVQRQDLECWPWLTLERSILPSAEGLLEIEARHVVVDERTLASSFTFTNQGTVPMTLRPSWRGMISGEHELYLIPYFIGTEAVPRTPFLEKIKEGIIGGLRISKEGNDLPQVAVRIRSTENKTVPRTKEGPTKTYQFDSPEPCVLAAKCSVEFQFCTEINFIAADQLDFVWKEEPVVALDFAELISSARARFTKNINLAKEPITAGPALALKAWRARYALLRNGMRGLDGEFGDELACLCTSDNTDFSCIFFWDTLFSSVAITDFHSAYAKGAIRTAFLRQDERDGSSPERKFNYVPKGKNQQQSPQSPVASWALRSYLAKHDDPAFLAELYPKLKKNHAFWEIYSDTDRDGLAEYRWSGQVCDNSPLWDTYVSLDTTTGCGWIPPVASVALNSFLHWDAIQLVSLAEQQNLVDDASHFRKRAADLEMNLMKVCYLPDEKRFWDYNHHTRSHRRVKTFYMFWPLFAGMSVPKEAAQDLIENVLLDPLQFFGDIPFPSVAYDEPTHDSLGYWRGRAWPHISYWLLQTLVRYGYVKEAKEAARRTLEAYSRSTGFPENVAAQVGDFEAAGFSDYNWGCAAVYLIATEEYLKA